MGGMRRARVAKRQVTGFLSGRSWVRVPDEIFCGSGGNCVVRWAFSW